MLRKLWWRLMGDPKPDRLEALLNIMITNQERTTQAVFNAVTQIAEASQKQADVLNSYLQLFKTPDEPRTWTEDIEETNTKELAALGFPKDGTEKQQADWVLANLDKI